MQHVESLGFVAAAVVLSYTRVPVHSASANATPPDVVSPHVATKAAVGVAVCTEDGVLVPTEFVADTLNQYAWPLVRPVMVFVVAVLPVLATATAKPADALVVDCSIL